MRWAPSPSPWTLRQGSIDHRLYAIGRSDFSGVGLDGSSDRVHHIHSVLEQKEYKLLLITPRGCHRRWLKVVLETGDSKVHPGSIYLSIRLNLTMANSDDRATA